VVGGGALDVFDQVGITRQDVEPPSLAGGEVGLSHDVTNRGVIGVHREMASFKVMTPVFDCRIDHEEFLLVDGVFEFRRVEFVRPKCNGSTSAGGGELPKDGTGTNFGCRVGAEVEWSRARVSSVVSVAPGASSRTGRNFHEGSSPSQSEMPQRVWSSRPVALSPSPVTPSFRGGTVGSGSDFFGTKDNRMELQLMFGTSLRAQDTRTIGGRAATADALLEYEEWCDGKELSPRDRLKGFELLGQWNDKEGCPRIRDLIRGMKSDAVDEGGPPPGWIDVLTEFRLLCAIVQSSDAAVDAAKAIVQGDAVHVCAYLEVKIMAFRQARPHNWSQAKVVQSLLNGMNSDCKGIFKARHHSVLIAVPRAEKTDRKWKGPFEVVGTYGPTGALFAVVVRIPNNPDRRVFKAQIGRVKPHHMPSQLRNVAPPTPIVLEEGDVFYEVAAIIRRVSADGFLVSWKGFGRNADSVVPEAELRQSSPELLREYESRTVFGPPVEDFG